MTLLFFGERTILPIQLHGLSYGLFASLVAPFGGIFASAIKRAYKKKDFDSFMPGNRIIDKQFFHMYFFYQVNVFNI